MGFWNFAWKVLVGTAKVTAGAGKLGLKGTVKVAQTAYEHREQIAKAATVVADTTITVAAVAGYGTYKAAEATTKTAYKYRKEIGGTVHGAVVGTAGAVVDASGHLLDIESRVARVEAQSAEFHRRTEPLWKRLKSTDGRVTRRDVALDLLAVGGATLASYVDGTETPSESVQAAFEAAYPHLSKTESFVDVARRLDPDSLEGFVSAVKGKLFEIEYVDFLNDGNLPSGYTAELAESVTQAGWDIQVNGPDAAVVELIQAKATDSVSYVAEALRRYPNIDVITTSEVHAALVMQGYGERVADSGLSEASLQTAVESAVDGSTIQMDWMPSSVALALIAFSAYTREDLDAYAKSRNFGERASGSYLAYLAGGAVAVVTQTWWIGLISGVGTRFVIGSGRRKWDQKARLDLLIADNQRVLARLPRTE